MLAGASKVQHILQHADSSTLHHNQDTVQQQEQIEAATAAEVLAAQGAQAEPHSDRYLSCLEYRLKQASEHQQACIQGNST